MPNPASPEPRGNFLLDSLSEATRLEILGAAAHVDLRQDQTLYGALRPASKIYFPLYGVISLMMPCDDGSVVETVSVGRDGFAGLAVALGAPVQATGAVVRVSGAALSVSAATIVRLMETRTDLRERVLRFAALMLAETEIVLGCTARHSVLQRCARWILSTDERADHGILPVTHENLGDCTGAQRPSVTLAANRLRNVGSIEYRRGQLRVVDRDLLREMSCGCHEFIASLRAQSAAAAPGQGSGGGGSPVPRAAS
jgi:CRP-like cAMP-binding protein